MFYGFWMLLISVILSAMWRYISDGHRLLPDEVNQARIDHIARFFQPNIALYGVAIALAFFLPQEAAALFRIIAVVGFIRVA